MKVLYPIHKQRLEFFEANYSISKLAVGNDNYDRVIEILENYLTDLSVIESDSDAPDVMTWNDKMKEVCETLSKLYNCKIKSIDATNNEDAIIYEYYNAIKKQRYYIMSVMQLSLFPDNDYTNINTINDLNILEGCIRLCIEREKDELLKTDLQIELFDLEQEIEKANYIMSGNYKKFRESVQYSNQQQQKQVQELKKRVELLKQKKVLLREKINKLKEYGKFIRDAEGRINNKLNIINYELLIKSVECAVEGQLIYINKYDERKATLNDIEKPDLKELETRLDKSLSCETRESLKDICELK